MVFSKDKSIFLISGPCVIESEGLVIDIFGRLKKITDKLDIEYISKS
jgi:2-dehydro-3-deoxyphosphooctonate aldolase (KDO 8-P synthase)